VKKLLIISHSNRLGGAQSVLLALIRDLFRYRYECHVVFPRAGPFSEQVEALEIFSDGYPVKVHFVRLKWWGGFYANTVYKIVGFLLELPDSVRAIAQIIREERIDLVLSNTVAMVDGALAARVCRVPHVWYVHELLSRDPKLVSLFRLEFLYPLVLMMSREVIAVSNEVRDEITRYSGPIEDPSKVKVVYSGLKNQPEQHPRSRSQLVISAGGICRRKGQLDLLRAAKIVCEHVPEAQFVTAGSPWEEEYMAALLRERESLGMQDKFHIIRFQDDMDAFYRRGSVFAMAATCESFGLVLAEAMSYGLPVVSTACGGPSEIVWDGHTGYLVGIADAHLMAKAIIRLLRNPDLADKMGQAGRERVKAEFGYDRFLNQVGEIVALALEKGWA
jgi:glycosyltransferase involved in cell wall biosynthesis